MRKNRRTRVAVVGGDGRYRDEAPGQVELRVFECVRDGGHAAAKRVLRAIAAGGVDVVVLLVNWIGHTLAKQVRAACRRAGVVVRCVSGGRSSLRAVLDDLGEV